ncbi:hypothetical protein [Desulfosarcina cetonica]|uniref:hypothetical protein n=1 Tax=Desulfosarcina cetonica TaxID=90730 RepID=UPI0012ED2382|nr:hypothetical protein [Desulfosarcina cetonica]
MKPLKLSLVVFSVICTLSGYTLAPASEWGCKCILCISNPGGATEFSECEPPIRKLKRHLEHGGSFPKCESAAAAGYTTKQGYVKYYTCEESYGEGWDPIKVFGKHYCRKFIGYKIVITEYGDSGTTHKRKVKDYEYQKRKKRENPYYIDLVASDGTTQRFWYRY